MIKKWTGPLKTVWNLQMELGSYCKMVEGRLPELQEVEIAARLGWGQPRWLVDAWRICVSVLYIPVVQLGSLCPPRAMFCTLFMADILYYMILCCGGCLAHCGMFVIVLGLCPLDAGSKSLSRDANVSRHYQMVLWRGKNTAIGNWSSVSDRQSCI